MPSIKSLKNFDKKLIRIENSFANKLDNFYTSLSRNIGSGINKSGEVGAKTERILTTHFVKYFKQVKNLGSDYAEKTFNVVSSSTEKAINTTIDKTAEFTEKVINKTAEFTEKTINRTAKFTEKIINSDYSDLIYAKKLAKKQIKDYYSEIKEALKKKFNPVAVALPIKSKSVMVKPVNVARNKKEIIKLKTIAFKNQRSQSTANTESNRIINNLFLLYCEQFGIDKVKFVAVLDSRTSDICRPKNGLIIDINDTVKLLKNKPPLHCYCRSMLIPVI